jgi:hypothetical protein
MSVSRIAAAGAEIATRNSVPKVGEGSTNAATTAGNEAPDDIELMRLDTVISREAGERDPLLLRDKVISEEALEGLRK